MWQSPNAVTVTSVTRHLNWRTRGQNLALSSADVRYLQCQCTLVTLTGHTQALKLKCLRAGSQVQDGAQISLRCWCGLVARASRPAPGWPRLRAAAATASACRHGAREGCSRSESSKYLPVFLSAPASEVSLPLPLHLALVYAQSTTRLIFFVCLNILSLIKIQSCLEHSFSPSCILVEMCN